MEIAVYQVDAFTNAAFRGNPAAVCPLQYWLDDTLMQNIAAENNLSETAFFVARGSGYHIRWFTPTCEVELCGHATLASAFILWSELGATAETLVFDSLSGPLEVTREGALLCLNFPARPVAEPLTDPRVATALGGVAPLWVGAAAGRVLVELTDESAVAALKPDFAMLKNLPYQVFYVTSVAERDDFVARVFAPAQGIDEDPATGSAYTALTPYWSERLHKQNLTARQISKRGGNITTWLAGDRVLIAGEAVCVM